MNALIDMYGKCGALKRTQRVFDEMCERDLLGSRGGFGPYGECPRFD